LGHEIEDAITVLLDPVKHPENKFGQIVLLGHSRGGLSARAFLEGSSANKSAVIGLLTTSSPHLGSRMGRISDWLTLHPRHESGSNGQELLVAPPGSQIGDPLVPINQQDWDTVDFLISPNPSILGGTATVTKPVLDVRRPVIMDMADNSLALMGLNNSMQVASLPANIKYGEIAYQKANFGLLSIGFFNYSVFGNGGATIVGTDYLSLNAETFLLNGLGLDDPTYIGDGLIPAGRQVFTQLSGFPQPSDSSQPNKIPRLINSIDLVVHTGAPSQIADLSKQLRLLAPPGWIP
jgi:hypothetical protein